MNLSLALTWTSLDTWIVVAGGLCATSCALLGNFLVLRRMSMMGDAISHAVLPGLAMAFLITVWLQEKVVEGGWVLPAWLERVVMEDARSGPLMLVGAIVVGVLTALLTQAVHHFAKVEEGASMGVVFTTLFALGLVLIVRAADHVDLDPGCVLYGSVETVPLRTQEWWGWTVPQAVPMLAGMFLFNAALVALLFKELKIASFDPQLATTLGINAKAMHYLLMTLVAATTVVSFESVGSILVIAMLIVPAATAHLLTDRLPSMIVASVVVAWLAAGLGHLAAITVPAWFGYSDTITAGGMATVAGLMFAATAVFSPRHGVASKAAYRARLALRIAREDVLGLLYRIEEGGMEPDGAGRGATREAGAGMADLRAALHVGRLPLRVSLAALSWRGLVERGEDGATYRLTEAGRAAAADLIRSHRLWETYFARNVQLPTSHLHGPAERLEHVTGSGLRERLDERVERPAVDPHGKPIPGGGPG